jgi:hypothetical protein
MPAIHARSSVITTTVDDGLVLLDLDSERYYSFNETAADMWQALQAHPTVEAAANELLAAYDVDEATLRADLDELIADLQSKQLIDVASA